MMIHINAMRKHELIEELKKEDIKIRQLQKVVALLKLRYKNELKVILQDLLFYQTLPPRNARFLRQAAIKEYGLSDLLK